MDNLRTLYEEHGGDLGRVADALGLDRPDLPTFTYTPRRRVPPPGTGHRPGWPSPRFIVAIRHCDGPWLNEDQKGISKARDDYEAGTHEMCTGRQGDWFILFSVPRKKRCGARKFFTMGDEG